MQRHAKPSFVGITRYRWVKRIGHDPNGKAGWRVYSCIHLGRTFYTRARVRRGHWLVFQDERQLCSDQGFRNALDAIRWIEPQM